jgi:hypothetical protein
MAQKTYFPLAVFLFFFYTKNILRDERTFFYPENFCRNPLTGPGQRFKTVVWPFFTGQKDVFPVPDGAHFENKKFPYIFFAKTFVVKEKSRDNVFKA